MMEAIPDYSFKFIVVGDCAVGKSCLLLRFIDDKFKSVHDLTIGVEYGSKVIQVGNSTIKLQIWDTAGTESFHSITKGYYKGSIGAFVVYDISNIDSFTNVKNWIEELIEIAGAHISICLVGAKDDLESEWYYSKISSIAGRFHMKKGRSLRRNIKFCFLKLQRDRDTTWRPASILWQRKFTLAQLEESLKRTWINWGLHIQIPKCHNNLKRRNPHAPANR